MACHELWMGGEVSSSPFLILNRKRRRGVEGILNISAIIATHPSHAVCSHPQGAAVQAVQHWEAGQCKNIARGLCPPFTLARVSTLSHTLALLHIVIIGHFIGFAVQPPLQHNLHQIHIIKAWTWFYPVDLIKARRINLFRSLSELYLLWQIQSISIQQLNPYPPYLGHFSWRR